MVLGIYFANGLGAEIMALAEEVIMEKGDWMSWKDIVFVEDDPAKIGTTYVDRRVLSYPQAIEEFGKDGIEFVIATRNAAPKTAIYEKLKADGCKMGTVLHPNYRFYGIGTTVGDGEIKFAQGSCPPYSTFGNNVLILQCSIFGHNLVVGDNVVLSSHSFVGGDTTIGKNTFVGPHACIRNGLHIGENCVIGMGAIVTKDVPDNSVVYGSPARVIRQNDPPMVFED